MAQFEIECIESHILTDRNLYGKFKIEKLKRGQGFKESDQLQQYSKKF